MARPTDYSEQIADVILDRISEGESLRAICTDEGMPCERSVYRWLRKHDEFSQKYARARQTQADAIFDDILYIADDARNDWMERNGEDDAGWQVNGEHIQRSKLRIDARKWMAGKLRPKVYGDKIAIGGDEDAPPIKHDHKHNADRKLSAYLDAIASRTTGESSE